MSDIVLPTISNVNPLTGPTVSGDVVHIRGSGFAARIALRFDDPEAEVLSVRDGGRTGDCR